MRVRIHDRSSRPRTRVHYRNLFALVGTDSIRKRPVKMVTKSEWKELVELAQLVAPGILGKAPPIPDANHFYTCHYCDQTVDRRLPADVLHHDRPGHSPRPR